MITLFQPDVGWCADYVRSQVASGRIGPGARVAEFEGLLAEIVGVRHAICTTSGTTALLLSLMACGADGRCTVAFPAYGMPAGANAARLLGALVQLFDVCDTGVMDWRRMLDCEHSPKACIIIGHNGCAIDDEAAQHCKRNGIFLLEDACQSLGVPGAGLAGHVACFSFSPQKIVTTGQGGAVVTDDDRIAARVRELIDHGGGWRDERIYRRTGGNFRMSDVAAALGVPQLQRLSELLDRRRRIRDWYRSCLPQIPQQDGWMVIFRSNDAARLVAHLKSRGIESMQLYPPVSYSPVYQSFGSFPVAEKIHRTWVYLPSHLRLRRDEVVYIARSVLEVECAESEEAGSG